MTHVEDDRRPMLRKVIHTYLCPSCGHTYEVVKQT